jgi:DNA-binding LacI/PurR family transcriptional regulator
METFPQGRTFDQNFFEMWKRFQLEDVLSTDGLKKNPTIKDVALLAGCGIASASRALNESGFASPELRARVLAAAEELGFDFSDVGRSLQSQSTGTVGCVVPTLFNPIFSDAVQGIQDVVVDSGRQLLLSCSNYDPERELSAVRTLIAKRVDALVLNVMDSKAASATLDLIRSRQIPYCLLFNHDPDSPNAFAVDNSAAADDVAHAFAKAGHRHIAFVGLRTSTALQRRAGLERTYRNLGLNTPAVLEVDERPARLQEDLVGFLRSHPKVTGIFASNDQLALAIYETLRKLGLKVPDDLSIVGFDGIGVGQMLEPTLATVVTDPYAMARAAADMALSAGSSVQSPVTATVAGHTFRSGGSLGPAATGTSLVEKLRLSHQSITRPKTLESASKERR